MDKIKKLIEAREITEVELIKRKINELVEAYNEIKEIKNDEMDMVREYDNKINIHQVVIWQMKQDICTECEKQLEKIFKDFMNRRV